MIQNHKTKLLLIGPVPPSVGGKTSGGIATHLWELALHAVTKGYEVFVLGDTIGKSANVGPIRIIAFPSANDFVKGVYGAVLLMQYLIQGRLSNIPEFINLREQIKLAYYLHYIKKLADTIKPNIIHLHNEHSRAALALSFMQNNIPYIFTDHAFWQTTITLFHKEKVKWIIKHAACLTYTSDYCIKKHDELYLEFRKRKKILYPLEVKKFPYAFSSNLAKQEVLQILFVGVWEAIERKGLDILIKGFFECVGLERRLKIVTTQETIRYCQTAYGSVYDLSKVDFYPPQLPDKLSQMFREADIFVMPSRSESFGIVYLESLLHGTPVIGFFPVVKEIADVLGCYIGEPFDAINETHDQLAKKIQRVSTREIDRTLLQKSIVANFSWDVLWEEYDVLYSETRKETDV